jgi:hypothetical protein
MKKKIISLLMVNVIGFGLVGCGENKESQATNKTITGTVIESGDGGWDGRYKNPYYIKIQTDSGDVTLNCNEKYSHLFNKGLKVNITYDSEMYVTDINVQ